MASILIDFIQQEIRFSATFEKKDDKNCNVQLTAIFLQRIILRLADRQISGCSAAW
jgi:hypothetical protein